MSTDLRALEWYAIERRDRHPMDLGRILEVRCRWDGGVVFRFARSTDPDGPWYCERSRLRRGIPVDGADDVEWVVRPMWARPEDNLHFDGWRLARGECPTCGRPAAFSYSEALELWANNKKSGRI